MIQFFDTATRVALVSGGLKLGGSTTFLCNLGGELIRRGIATEVVSFENENPMSDDFVGLNIPVICFDDRRIIFEDRIQRVLASLRRFQPTVVVATLSASSFEVLRYLPPGVFRVAVAQSDDSQIYPLIAQYASYLDLVAVVSSHMKAKMLTQPALANIRVDYLRHGVPMCADTELPRRDFTQPLRVLYHGRMESEQKRVHLFPQIMAQLKAAGLPFHWTIAGDGSERAALVQTMQDSPAQTVSFPGHVNYTKVPELLRTHDVCLLTSDYEGFGLSVAEAMGYGLVPVVSDLPAGIPEMVDQTTGLLVPVADVAGYARAIIHLHQHREELAAKSAAARARVAGDFSVAAMADRWLAAFPPPPTTPPVWPQSWNISAPLPAKNSLRFSAPARIIRRMVAKFRG